MAVIKFIPPSCCLTGAQASARGEQEGFVYWTLRDFGLEEHKLNEQ